MTLPELKVGQKWFRKDGKSVLIEGPTSGASLLYAEGTYYGTKEFDDCYPALTGIRGHGLVKLDTTAYLPVDPPEVDVFPELAVGQRWRRRDGVEGVITEDSDGNPMLCTDFFFDGFRYSRYVKSDLGGLPYYEAPSCGSNYDLVDCLGYDVEAAEDPEAEDRHAAHPRRLESFGYSDGVFCGLDEEGGAWYLRENASEWIKLPPLPNS